MRVLVLSVLISILAAILALSAFFISEWNRQQALSRNAVNWKFEPSKQEAWTVDGPRDESSPRPSISAGQ
jgi:hypothetical protein